MRAASQSLRSYDNEKRRLESWLGEYLAFRQNRNGKRVFFSLDSRRIPCNPLYQGWKSASFTKNDIRLHFILLDILADGKPRSVGEILAEIDRGYRLEQRPEDTLEESTLRKKLREYQTLGLVEMTRNGRQAFYSLAEDSVNLKDWREAVWFFSEAAPRGVVGSFLLDKYRDFSESPFSFKSEDFQTPLRHPPQMPLTLLQKRWMKSVLMDPRVGLFGLSPEGLEGVEPLFDPADLVCFDRYGDSDPFSDPGYAARFRILLQAVLEKRMVRIDFVSRRGLRLVKTCFARKLEYSAKDDKFRLCAESRRGRYWVNLARISFCALLDPAPEREPLPEPPEEAVELLLTDERNALERVLLHFSDCRKETQRMENGQYQLRIWYDPADRAEILIRVLSFGPVLRAVAPESFVSQIRERLAMQRRLSGDGKFATFFP